MLPDERRKQLDGIVSQMVSNGEKDDAINFVVNDFKSKYSQPEPESSFIEKTASVLDSIFGGGKIGEYIGTKIAKSSESGKQLQQMELTGAVPKGTAEETFKTPTAGQLAGSALQSAALFIPAGTAAKGITSAARAVGLKTGASALGKIGSGALAGEVFDIASNLQQGKTGAEALTPGWGTVLGGAIPAASVVKNVAVRFGEKQAPRVINSLIKPLAKDFSYGKNPGRAVAEEGIVANNFEDLIKSIQTSRQKIGEEIGQLGDTLSQTPQLNIRQSLSSLDEAIKVAASQNNATLLNRINSVKRAITEVLEPVVDDAGNMTVRSVGSKDLENLTFKQVRNVLRDVGDLTQFTGNPSDDKLINAALKRVYGSIKEESLKAADNINPELAKRFRKLTEKYADLTSAEVAAKYRDKIVERQDLLGFSSQQLGIASGLVTAIATGGATLPAAVVGITTAALNNLAKTPGFKTRLAYILSKKTQSEASYLFRKIPALKEFFNVKEGITPGDVVLSKGKKVIEKAKTLPNQKGGFIKVPGAKSTKINASNADAGLVTEAKKYKSAEEFVKEMSDSRVMNPKFNAVAESPEFRSWFGKSKLVDPAGNVVKKETPTVFYHRSSADFDNFLSRSELEAKGVKLPDYRDTDSGFYFSRKDAGDYYGNKKYAVALRAENPKKVRRDISSISDSQIQKLKAQGYDAIESPDEIVIFDKDQIWPLTKNGQPIGKTKSQLTDIWKKANKK